MALADVLDVLACPVCRGSLSRVEQSLRCPEGHSFDVARQGYVTLAAGPIRHPGDTVEMVEARERVHRSGAFEPVVHWVLAALPEAQSLDVLVDVGGGIGTYAEAALGGGLVRRAVVLDSSKPALRRAGRGVPSLAAVGCDLVDGYPVRSGVADAVLVAFAPRNATELARVTRTGARLVVVTPEPGHLAQLQAAMGLLTVDEGKPGRVAAAMAADFELTATSSRRATVEVACQTAVDLAQMGPAGFHASRVELEQRAAALPDQVAVDLAVTVSTLTRLA